LFVVLIFALAFIPCGTLICGGAMMVGMSLYSLNLVRRSRPDIGNLFAGFNRFGDALVAYLLMMVFICLWTLLLIIPGIIAAYRYSLAFYLLADNPHLTGYDAIKRSGELMRGHKWRLFCLDLWVTLLSLACVFTCFIGYLWVMPYARARRASFYDDILRRQAKPEPTQP
jgi:uncharacterized membrane protein